MESYSASHTLTFAELHARLIKAINARIQNGEFTERGLARMLGISQPQIHNLLKGARKLRPEVADRLIASLKMALVDLIETAELHEQLAARPAEENDWFAHGASAIESQLMQKRGYLRATPKKPPTSETAHIPSEEEQAS